MKFEVQQCDIQKVPMVMTCSDPLLCRTDFFISPVVVTKEKGDCLGKKLISIFIFHTFKMLLLDNTKFGYICMNIHN